MVISENIRAGFSHQSCKTRAAMTSLTLPIEPLVDFFLNSILEAFCFLLHSKVEPNLAVLQWRNEQRYTQTKAGFGDTRSRREGVCLHLQQRCGSTALARSRRAGCRAPAPRRASLPVDTCGLMSRHLVLLAGYVSVQVSAFECGSKV